MPELLLKGSLGGVKKIKPYENPDILYSIVDKYNCKQNKLMLSSNPTNTFYVFHSYYAYNDNLKVIRDDRWYNTRLEINKESINQETKSFNVLLKNVIWSEITIDEDGIEIEDITSKDIQINIYFSDKGYKKFIKFITKNSNIKL